MTEPTRFQVNDAIDSLHAAILALHEFNRLTEPYARRTRLEFTRQFVDEALETLGLQITVEPA